MTMLRNITRGAVATAIAALGVAAPTSSASALGCSISNFTPRVVIIGLAPVQRTFDVSHSCGGGQYEDWNINIGRFDAYVYDSAPTQVFYPPSYNKDAGAKDVVVEASGYDSADNSINATRIFLGGFRLKRQTTISFNAAPEPVKYRSPLSLRGRLFRANWDTVKYDALGGRTVAVQFRTATGPYSTVKTVTTDSSGRVATSVTATRSGVWRLHYRGNSVEGASSSVADAVAVTR